MGIKQSKRSVDITATPKKDALENASNDANNLPADGKLEKIEELNARPPTSNGSAVHTETTTTTTATAENKDKDEATEKEQPTTEQVSFLVY